MTSDRSDILALLRTTGVPTFMAGRFLAAAGIWAERLTVGWLVWELTASASWIGIVAALRMGPALVLSPIGGVLTDRIGSVRLLRVCHGGNALILLAMVPFTAQLSLAALAIAVTLMGILQGLSAAPIKAVVPQIVPRHLLTAAIPLSSATFQLAAFIGPAAAGLVLAGAGAWLALAVASASHAVFVIVLRNWSDAGSGRGGHGDGVWSDLVESSRHCLQHPALRPVLAIHIAAAFSLRPLIDLMPAVAAMTAPGSATALGLLTAASGAGALGGASWMTLSPRANRLGWRVACATVLSALGLMALSAVLGLGGGYLAIPVLFFFGFALVSRATASLTLVQLTADRSKRGTVVGLYSMIMRGGTAIGAIAIGVLADLIGLPWALILSALVSLTVLARFGSAVAQVTPRLNEDDAATRPLDL